MKAPVINHPHRQKGLALLLLVITIILAVITYMVSELSMTDVEYQEQIKTRAALKKAKQALLAFAMNYPDTAAGLGNLTQGPGNFPCPDDDFDGNSDNPGVDIPGCTSGGPGTIGRFPWAEVGVEELRDGSGELLWYAISSNYVNATGGMVNTSAVGEITLKKADGSIEVDGTTINGVVAVIIAPGDILVRDDGLIQSRSTVAEREAPQNYLDIAYVGDVLEEDNASYTNDDVNGFIRGPIFNAANQIIVNDQIEVITYGEIMQLVHARAANDIGNVIEEYFIRCGAFPDAAAFDPAGGGLFNSVPGLDKGLLPVGIATPLDWDQDHPAYCNLTDVKFPEWVTDEEWHLNTYYQYAYTNPTFPPGPPGTSCTPGADCLTVNDMPAPDDNKVALIMFAGRALDADAGLLPPLNAQVRHNTDLANYFEVVNNDGTTVFDMTPYDSEVPEDYIRVIMP